MKHLAATAIILGSLAALMPAPSVCDEAPDQSRMTESSRDSERGREWETRRRGEMQGGYGRMNREQMMINRELPFRSVFAERLGRRVYALRFDLERIRRSEEDLERQVFELDHQSEEDEELMEPERVERMERMVDLKKELLELEKEELLFRVRTETTNFVRHLDSLLERPDDELPLEREVLEKVQSRAREINAAAKEDFDTLYTVATAPDPATSDGRLTQRDQRLVEEIKLLKQRLRKLESDLEGPPQFQKFGPMDGHPEGDPWMPPPHPPISPDQLHMDELPGTDAPAPPVERNGWHRRAEEDRPRTKQ